LEYLQVRNLTLPPRLAAQPVGLKTADFELRGLRDQDSNLEPTGQQRYVELNHPTLPFLPCVSFRCARYLGRHLEKLDGCTLLV
jgi:hypothetical protein